VKPDNILMDRGSGRAMITDFGIARSQNNTSGLTQVGEIIGTPQYMSPEQAIGDTIDARSDLYSLGVVAFFALTGRLPFESSTPHGYLTAHITKAPPPIASVRPDLPAGLSAAVDKLLQKDPAQRFQKGEELAEALDPLRASRREIPPAIRLFHVKSTQVIRNALILAFLAPTIANSAGGDADRALFLIIILSAVFALMMQALNGLRELAAQGFSHDDLRNGITAISEEESEARAQMRAAPDWRERRRRQQVRSVIGLVVGAVLIFFAVKTRVPLSEGRFHTPIYGAIAITLGAVIVMVTLVYAAAAGGASARLDRRLRALWTGALGRRLYERVQKQVARTRPAVRVVSAELGPNTLIEQLPKDVRRELGEVTRVIAALVATQKEMVDREAKLTSSQMEASRGSLGVATDTLDRVITELSDAKQAAVQKREDISTALERIRLELIRLRSGVGNIADVKRESDKAKALISS
jgi:serine/threonine-protein kinase